MAKRRQDAADDIGIMAPRHREFSARAEFPLKLSS
jgi:hypothetical protein